MQLLLDNLLATIVTSTVFLILVSVNWRSQQNKMDSINHYALKKQEINFVETIKKDLAGVNDVVTVKEQADGSFTFQTYLDMNSSTLYEVTYKREFVGMRLDDSLFQIKRFEKNLSTGAIVYGGSSMLTVTTWKIEAHTTSGQLAGIPAAAQQIYVRFEATLPFETDWQQHGNLTLTTSRWEATFRPPLLRNKGTVI